MLWPAELVAHARNLLCQVCAVDAWSDVQASLACGPGRRLDIKGQSPIRIVVALSGMTWKVTAAQHAGGSFQCRIKLLLRVGDMAIIGVSGVVSST